MTCRFTIYCHTNRVNGKRYVGQTVYSMEKRWAAHVSSAKSNIRKNCRAFIAAIRKYGADVFDHQVLEVVDTQEEADLLEALWIEQMGCRVPNGYNIDRGGNGPGRHHDETKRLISESLRARWEKMTSEERAAAQLRPAEHLRSWWKKMTPDERNVARRKRADGFRSRWQKMTDEEKSARQVARQKTVSPEKRSSTIKKAWETRREKYGQKGVSRVRSAEEHGASIKKGWAKASPEARAKRVQNIKDGVRKAREAKNFRLVRINLFAPAIQ
jgi:group I intron endonuclease